MFKKNLTSFDHKQNLQQRDMEEKKSYFKVKLSLKKTQFTQQTKRHFLIKDFCRRKPCTFG